MGKYGWANGSDLNTSLLADEKKADAPEIEMGDISRSSAVAISLAPDGIGAICIDHKWIETLSKLSPLPDKYKFASNYTSAFMTAAICTVGASVLLVDGAKNAGLPYILGGVGVEAIQNMLFGTQAYFYYKDCAKKFPTSLVLFFHFDANYKEVLKSVASLLGTLTLAAVATLPVYFAELKESNGNQLSADVAFAGKFPLNVFAIASALLLVERSNNDNPALRDFLRAKYRAVLQQYPDLLSRLEPERSKFSKTVVSGLGALISCALVASISGYGCATSNSAASYLGSAKTLAGIAATLPTAIIAVLITGHDASKRLVYKLTDLVNKKSDSLSMREKKFLAAFLALTAVTSVMSLYSNATQLDLYESECSKKEFGSMLYAFLHPVVEYGTIAFNGILSIFAARNILNYFKFAYADGWDRVKYQIKMMEKTLVDGDIKELYKMVLGHFRDDRTWKVSLTQNKSTLFSSASGFVKPAASKVDANALESIVDTQAKPVASRRKSICIIS